MGKFRSGVDSADPVIENSSFAIWFQSTTAQTCSATGEKSALIALIISSVGNHLSWESKGKGLFIIQHWYSAGPSNIQF